MQGSSLHRDLKKFLKKVVLCALLVAVTMVMLHFVYLKSELWIRADTRSFFKVPDSVQVVNLGSSHGWYDFDYSQVGDLRGVNLGLHSQDFYYDYQVLDRFKGHLAPGCVVLIPVSYFSFGKRADTSNPSYAARYYGILKYSSIKKHNLVDYLKAKVRLLFAGSNLALQSLPGETPLTSGQLGANTKLRASSHKEFTRPSREVSNYTRGWLCRTIELCQKNGLKPVLVTPPFSKSYNDCFTEEDLAVFDSSVSSICEKYGLDYLDYARDPRLAHPRYFIDSDHMNKRGAKKFTDLVVDELVARGLCERRSDASSPR
jgi:hypothetical protein